MKVILKQNVPNLGYLGDEVKVKPGYARNFLIPKGLALNVTASNAKEFAFRRKAIDAEKRRIVEESQSLSDKIAGLDLSFTVKAGKGGKLFGSVTTKQIVDELLAKGIDLPKQSITSSNLKQLGAHVLDVKLHTEVSCKLTVNVVAESSGEEEATEAPGDDGIPEGVEEKSEAGNETPSV